MASSTVNISDFRCRVINVRHLHPVARLSGAAAGPVEVEPESRVAREAELLREALISENPDVFDIGIARDAQRMRQRMVFRLIPVQRNRGNVIRFGEPGVTVMRPKGSVSRLHYASISHDRDLPPAA
ncbi:MAG TPA: hypothetical protein VGJ21_17445 [Terracidiphilus sp.]